VTRSRARLSGTASFCEKVVWQWAFSGSVDSPRFVAISIVRWMIRPLFRRRF
jgi:hypothetical protein